MLIDDFSHPPPLAANGSAWGLVTDQVMGGSSAGTLLRELIDGREAVRLKGEVQPNGHGGFVLMAIDVRADGRPADISGFAGVVLTVLGNGQEYHAHLRTAGTIHPWQSFRCAFVAEGRWSTVRLPFAGFRPHRTDRPLDLTAVRRLAVAAHDRPCHADLAVARAAFYTDR